MRSNIIIGLVLCGLVASLGIFLMGPRNAPPATVITPLTAPAAQTGPDAPPEMPAVRQPASLAASTAAVNHAEPSGGETPEQLHEAYVTARSAELMDLAMNEDADSLNTILSELANRDPQIRKTAVEAAVQFHSRDAIPRLQDAALQTDDAKERAAIQDAIEFLKLPTLTEALQEQARQAAASGTNPAAPKQP